MMKNQPLHQLKEFYTVQWLTSFQESTETLFRGACFEKFYRPKFPSKLHKNRQTTTYLTEVSNNVTERNIHLVMSDLYDTLELTIAMHIDNGPNSSLM